MDGTDDAASFPLPSEIADAPGAEDWRSMYPYFTRFQPEDDQRFWFYNSMHFPEPIPAFDMITAEVPYSAIGANTARVFVFPTTLGIEHRIVNGRVYITAIPVLYEAEIGRRAAIFGERASYYYENWDELYEGWKVRMRALIDEIESVTVPSLPEAELDRERLTWMYRQMLRIREFEVRVTPISETAEIGMAVGAALAGYRPVVELYMAEFMLVAMDQVVNEAPRFRYMSGGRVTVPLVLKAGYGFTAGWAGQHTGSIYGMFTGVPGLKVALPATPADAKGLMATAIRDDNPVCFFHHYLLTLEEGEVPEGSTWSRSARPTCGGPGTT